jgi:pimeloyl-ACP methyl ester carboxylesterase
MNAIYTPRRAARSRFLMLRGLQHHLLEWGEPDGRPPLVMLHGWMDVAASFQFVVDALASPRHVIAMDWRGFGLSDNGGADSYWFPDYLGDLDALLDAVSPSAPVDLLGHSMGGNVVMSYAGVRPQRVRKLINLEGFGLPDGNPERAPERLAEWLDALKTPALLKPYASLAAVADRLMRTNPLLAADKAHWLAAHWSREQDGQWIILGDPVHKRPNAVPYRKAEVMATWRRITAPLLWAEGAQTKILEFWGGRYPREEFEARLSEVKIHQRRVIDGAGHMLHHDRPEALAQEIQAFLDGV